MPTKTKQLNSPKDLLASGHRGCAGCGQLLAARHVANACGANTIITNATGCLEVTTSPYPESAWQAPWLHSVFENAAGTASGVLAALKRKGLADKVNVLAQGGDGGSFDIGFGLISGMWTRGENILYVCYDNEAYMNTGVQASGATSHGAHTTTSPAGKEILGNMNYKKDMLAIALAHKCVYVASATAGDVIDIQNKVKKALSIKGPKYIQILVPCTPGWGIDTAITVELSRLAQKTGHYPVVEYVNGELANVKKVPASPPKIEEYLKPQKRFKHLFKDAAGKAIIAELQRLADENIKRYGLK